MLATRIAATGTSSRGVPSFRRACSAARSFLQNRRSMRLSAIGFTFQVSPLWYVTCSSVSAAGAWKRWYMLEVRRSVT